MPTPILKIAVPVPIYGLFDYLAPAGLGTPITPGCRVQISFGRRQLVGVVVQVVTDSSIPAARLKSVSKLLDNPVPPEVLQLLLWAADYYHHPVGEVISTALPVLLRQPTRETTEEIYYCLTELGKAADANQLKRAPRQAQLFNYLKTVNTPVSVEQLNRLDFSWREPLKALQQKAWLTSCEPAASPGTSSTTMVTDKPALHAEQQQAIEHVSHAFAAFHAFLLEGITGSGKTEVYLNLVEQLLARNKQTLILVPEINLTPQLVSRFQQRFSAPLAVLHSAMTNNERLKAWQAARDNRVQIIIGTRSALFTPLADPGMIIIDEEHDSSFKQQDNFRYHTRDLALVRAKKLKIPVLMGSATPSLESIYNAQQGRFTLLRMQQRAGAASTPKLHLLDIRHRPMQEGLSDTLVSIMREHLEKGSQVLLYLNRRGFAPALLCHDCGWVMPCPRCDARMTYHHAIHLMRCHHCGHENRIPQKCPDCGGEEFVHIGIGTERLEKHISEVLPDFRVSRIDSDTTRRKGSLHHKLEQARSGEADILIGTQMLAKGHDFPNVTLVGILETDSGLFSSDFRAAEFMAQQIIQVAGRAGRADKPGEVYIQTHHPDHPLLQTLLHQGYHAFAQQALIEREQAQFPPYSSLVLIRAEATSKSAPENFLQNVSRLISQLQCKLEQFGPFPAPMEKRAGRYRAQLLMQSDKRAALQQCLALLTPQIQALDDAKKVRWSIDVDPQSML